MQGTCEKSQKECEKSQIESENFRDECDISKCMTVGIAAVSMLLFLKKKKHSQAPAEL